jgi:undecaprenyl-diphosphatase
MELLKFFEGIRSPFLDGVFSLITRLGEETVVIVVFCAIFWCINKRAAYRIGVAFFLSGLVVQGMKICFRIDRPWIIDPSLSPVPSAIVNATGYSFPSGHTQGAAALFGSLGVQIKQKSAKAVCLLLIILVALSRMYLGVHTLLDVAVSLLITLLFIVLSGRILPEAPGGKNREMLPALFFILFTVVEIVIAAALFSSGALEQAYVSDCMKAAGAGFGFAAGVYAERVYINFSVRSKNVLWQIVKLIAGIAGLLAIKEGLKLIIGTGLIADIARYFLMISWITAFFPLLIKKAFTAPGKSGAA